MPKLSNLKVAVIAADGVEESEIVEPVKALREAGATVEIISIEPGIIQAFRHFDKGSEIRVDRVIEEARADDYQALLLPGGALNADRLRSDTEIQCFVRGIENSGHPIAVICHAPWILISSGLMKGRTITSYPSIRDDIRNAGGEWVDQEVVVDHNWVASRHPGDLPAFNREMIERFSRFVPSLNQHRKVS
ncbi:MAG: protease [Bdellovibrionales bacterium GWB1_55_8]|nr:MAG: protease [Bdellovibrionales bacterium GWB1_55_8]